MQLEPCGVEAFDVLLLYGDEQRKLAKETITEQLRKRGVTTCDLEEDGMPNKTLLSNLIHLLKQSRCVVLIHPIPTKILNLLEVIQTVSVFPKPSVCLSYGAGSSTNTTYVINIDSTPQWVDEVIKIKQNGRCRRLLKDPIAILFKIPQESCLLHTLLSSGNPSFSSMNTNILGIQVMPSMKTVKLDLSHCYENIDMHEKLKTKETIEVLSFLKSISTEVELRVNMDVENAIDMLPRNIDELFATVCSCVLDVSGRKLRDWILVYTINGPSPFGRNLLARIYHTSRHAVIGSAFPETTQHPEYTDKETRRQTFLGTSFENKADKMAEAGFYYDGLNDRTRCYKCGGARIGWMNDDDPMYKHAEGFPKCPLVKAKMTEEELKRIGEEEFRRTVSGNKDYISIEKRRRSFDGFVKTPTTPTSEDVVPDCYINSLSEAGFYYVGPEDRVRCFSCGVMISAIRMRTRKELLIEHARVSPSCEHVEEKLQDGLQWINDTFKVSQGQSVVVKYFVKTFNGDQSEWPQNMLCS